MIFKDVALNKVIVGKIMNRDFVEINMTTELKEVMDILLEKDSNLILITKIDNGKVIPKAILNNGDVLKAFRNKSNLEDHINKNNINLNIKLNEDDKISRAFDLMIENNLEHIPIKRKEKVIGILSIGEIFKLYYNFFNESYDVFLKILDNINDAVSIVDENCITKFWNKSAERIYEINREDILDKPITQFFPNALLPKVIKEVRPYDNVYNSPRENCHNIISARPLYQGDKLIGGIGFDKDISELIRISELLNKTKSNLSVLEEEVSKLNEDRFSFSEINGNNSKFMEIINFSKSISKANINVLLTGESGTGKEVFARAIHIESGRKGYFVPINCSAIPAELMESELFGYSSGAFTGSLKEGKIGKFEFADKGTLFLDEIGDMSLKMQPKILRVIEDGLITRVGSDKSVKVDVRIIAATNKDIGKMVEKGTFRKDLYYRLNSILITLPPLKERKDDIPELVRKFIEDFSLEYRTNVKEISKELMDILINYDWEGNIRELKNIIERIVILAKNNRAEKIDATFLPDSIIKSSSLKVNTGDKSFLDLNTIIANAEKDAIIKAMKIANNNKAQAALLLNIPRSTLYFKLEKYNMEI